MKIYFHKFWSGFFDQTNPVDVRFFIELFTKVFDEPCMVGDLESSDILCETVYDESALGLKKWKRKILFSGEARVGDTTKYDLVLCGKRSHANIVNCPLFIPFLWCRNGIRQTHVSEVPPQGIVAIISNPGGSVRNTLIDMLEAAGFPITFAGSYKNNTGFTLPGMYCDEGFLDFIGQFKFVISMENSQEDTYITEKICSGFLANTIPIYWGSKRIGDYFNEERFIHMDPSNPGETISKLRCLDWLSYVNKPIFKEEWCTIDSIARDCKSVLYPCPLFPNIKQIYFLCNREYEPEKYSSLLQMTEKLGIKDHMYTFLAPSWGSNITPDTYSHHVRSTLHDMLPWWHGPETLKYSSLSLILNYRALLEDMTKRYSDSALLISFESDISPIYQALHALPRFLTFCSGGTGGAGAGTGGAGAGTGGSGTWGCIHFGYGSKCKDDEGKEVIYSNGEFSLIRHTNTRCTDTLLWKGSCAQAILDYMKETEEYSEPIDHYLIRYFEERAPLTHAWASHVFFKQSSNYLDYPPSAHLCLKHQAECHLPGEVPLRR
jgi:hypothetical protein